TRPSSAARDPFWWFALAMAGLWVLVPALINPGQVGDHFEQFTWAHSMEWGYHKHPPLPTWLLAITLKWVAATPYATYGVAALMLAGTALFTWLLARELLGARLASLAIVLWGLHWSFSWKGQMLNHNSVMMCCIAAAAWLALQASRRQMGSIWILRWWLGLGLVGGLAMLTKYQSAIPLVGVIIALWRAGHLHERDKLLGLLMAVSVALAVFAPHVLWVVNHDFVTLKYASSTVQQLDMLGRVRKLLSFSALQLRMLLWPLLCIGVLARWMRKTPAAASVDGAANERERQAWLLGLLGWPLVVLAVLCLAQGVRLQDHWGFQSMQFVSLWLAWQLRRFGPQAATRLLVLALVTHTLGLVTYSRSVWDPRTLAKRERPDQFYPAQTLAGAVMLSWKQATSCPLRYVVGGTYEAGMVSVYSGQNPVVFETASLERSPWVDLADLTRAGAVYVYSQVPEQLPGPLPLHRLAFTLPGGEKSLYDVYWAVVAPTDSCR
ncbi:MAG: glycosyltransferase family 39 protein, partial [Rhizobacter sp.]|nr:glycosyltransferase family 39 protein [Rhizobacter sp.]